MAIRKYKRGIYTNLKLPKRNCSKCTINLKFSKINNMYFVYCTGVRGINFFCVKCYARSEIRAASQLRQPQLIKPEKIEEFCQNLYNSTMDNMEFIQAS